MEVDVTEAEFWLRRYLPAGSVIVYADPMVKEAAGEVALLVEQATSDANGIWVKVRVLGASTKESKSQAQSYFKSKKRMLHICYLNKEETCPVGDEVGLHLKLFHWFPPGDFTADWLSAYAKKLVEAGKKMCLEEEGGCRRFRNGCRPETQWTRWQQGRGPSSCAQRGTPALRRVSFADELGPRDGSGKEGPRRVMPRGGTPPRAANSRSLVDPGTHNNLVKAEVIDLESEGEPKRKKKEKTPGVKLALAAHSHMVGVKKEMKQKRRRSRSHSKSKKRKRRRRKDSSEDSRSRSSSTESSSDVSLMPPLKKKALKSPGAVYQMLQEHARERLAQDAIRGEGDQDGESVLGKGSSTPFTSYACGPSWTPSPEIPRSCVS
eukprot:s1635_g19.t1